MATAGLVKQLYSGPNDLISFVLCKQNAAVLSTSVFDQDHVVLM